MDEAGSPQFYPDELEMVGDPIEIPFEPGIFVFKTHNAWRPSRSKHLT